MSAIGEFRHRIDLYTYKDIEEKGGSGTYKHLSYFSSVWGLIENIKGLVRYDTKQLGEEVTHKITIRYIENLTTEYWLGFGIRRFRIRFITDINERSQYLELLVEEKSIHEEKLKASIGKAGQSL